MNGKLAKWCRREVYGTEFTPTFRAYHATNVKHYKTEVSPQRKQDLLSRGFQFLKDKMKEFLVFETSTLVADERRREYKLLKKKVR